MKNSEPQPKMPKSKLVLFLLLLLVAFLIAIFLVSRRAIDGDRLTGILISAMLTLFILSLVELIPEGVRYIERWSDAGRFRSFFGSAVFKDDVRLVFAYRQLNQDLQNVALEPHYSIPVRDGQKPVAEGVNAWLAFQDIRAAVFVSSMLFKYTDRDVKFIHDKDIDQDDFGFCSISIGLGFNGFTHRLAKWCNDELYKIQWGPSPLLKKDSPLLTDNFVVGNGKVPVPPDGKDDCIVARIVPPQEVGKAQCVCFVCAGRTAPGTAAAGFYLAKNWSKLLELYKVNGKSLEVDSLVVVVRHGVDPSGMQEYESTGAIAEDGDGRQIINWWRVTGDGRK